jgi:hypothetical protein
VPLQVMLYAPCCGCREDRENGRVFPVLFSGTEPFARVLPSTVTVTSSTPAAEGEELGRVTGAAPVM